MVNFDFVSPDFHIMHLILKYFDFSNFHPYRLPQFWPAIKKSFSPSLAGQGRGKIFEKFLFFLFKIVQICVFDACNALKNIFRVIGDVSEPYLVHIVFPRMVKNLENPKFRYFQNGCIYSFNIQTFPT